MGSDCSKLSEKDEPCLVFNCIAGLKQISSRNAYSYDQFIATLKSGTNYKGEPIKEAYLKMWSMYSPLKTSLRCLEQRGCNFELCVQRYIIKPLIDLNICPFFIRLYGGSTQCDFSQYAKIIFKIFSDEKVGIEKLMKAETGKEHECILNIARTLSFNDITVGEVETLNIMRNPMIRPLFITPSVIAKGLGKPDLETMKAMKTGFIATEMYPHSLRDVLRSGSEIDVNCMFLQIAYACLALNASKTVHNNLTLSNIKVQQLDRAHVMELHVIEQPLGSEAKIRFQTSLMCKIGDFSKSLAVRYRHNPNSFLTLKNSPIVSHNYDFVRFMLSLKEPENFQDMSAHAKKSVVTIFSILTYHPHAKAAFDELRFFPQPRYVDTMVFPSMYEIFMSLPQTLNILSTEPLTMDPFKTLNEFDFNPVNGRYEPSKIVRFM